MSRAARLRPILGGATGQRARDLPAARRLRFSLTIEALERAGDGRPLTVLDAGCGSGLLSEELARRHPEWTILGADLDQERLHEGEQRIRSHGLPNLRFERLDLTEDLGSARFDAVLAIECLEEIGDDDAALARMSEALRPGGLLLVHVPERCWRPVLRGSSSTWKDEVRHGYTASELTAKLADVGVSTTAVVPTSRAVVRLAQELRDRLKHRDPALQLLAYPPSLAAVWLERRGLTAGAPRALFVEGVRQ